MNILDLVLAIRQTAKAKHSMSIGIVFAFKHMISVNVQAEPILLGH